MRYTLKQEYEMTVGNVIFEIIGALASAVAVYALYEVIDTIIRH